MNYAFTNGKILDGTKDMQVQTGLCILVQDGTITDIVPDTTDLAGYKTIDLQGRYIMPGLINMHVHLAGNGKPQKKQRDNEKLVKKIMRSSLQNIRLANIRVPSLILMAWTIQNRIAVNIKFW